MELKVILEPKGSALDNGQLPTNRGMQRTRLTAAEPTPALRLIERRLW